MPSLEDLTKETALPSSVFPSDHLRIEAIFECKGNKDNKTRLSSTPYKL